MKTVLIILCLIAAPFVCRWLWIGIGSKPCCDCPECRGQLRKWWLGRMLGVGLIVALCFCGSLALYIVGGCLVVYVACRVGI